MKVLEEHHNHELKKNNTYINRCPRCGSILEFEDKDIKFDEYCGDINKTIICPICDCWFGPFLVFHSKKWWKFRQKIKKIFGK